MMMSDDDANEKYMEKHSVPGGADAAADHHGGVQYSKGTPTMPKAGGMPTSSGRSARSSGGMSGRTGMPTTTGGKFNTGGRGGGTRSGGGGFGSARVSSGRSSSRR